MTRLVEDDVVEKLVVGMVFLMTGASFCNNVTEKEAEEEKKRQCSMRKKVTRK